MKRLYAALLFFIACSAAAAPLPQKVQSIEGVTEYRLANGLRVLLLPDPGIDTVTVNVMVLVGSREEGYGEKGMAHLLEHMQFRGSKGHPNIKDELTRHGARWNATTSNDRTTYFETIGATEDNIDWALGMEADRMVNSFISKKDLDSEMTVVRNEFEMGENNPAAVLFQRMQELAYQWHNYGHPVIGDRADIENVPIGKLQAFYRTWYQPDNAVLAVGGKFDEQRVLAMIVKHFGAIPRPARALPSFYTVEPTQDGERVVTLRRVGDTPLVAALYRVVAGSHPDYPAIDVLTHVLSDSPTGRLHKALVQKGLASYIWGGERGLHDPGYVYFGAGLAKDGDAGKARQVLIDVLENVRSHPVQPEEVERARTALLNDFEQTQLDTAAFMRALQEFGAIGDWRLYFIYRDRLKKVTVADVQRVAEHYLKRPNRIAGTFVPTAAPDRAAIPQSSGLEAAIESYKDEEGGVSLGEAFDPSPANIESRVVRRTLANDLHTALLPKKTRGGRVVAVLTLHWGDLKTLTDRSVACGYAGWMLMRGTQHHTRAELKDAFEKLNAEVSIDADSAVLQVRRENLLPALRLIAEVLREPSFPPSEFEELKRAAVTGAESDQSDPSVRASVRLARSLSAYPKGHPNYVPSVDERIERLRGATLQDARSCYTQLVGATGADFAAVGDFDAKALAAELEKLLGDWKTPSPFQRVQSRYFDLPAAQGEIEIADKANAVLRGGLDLPLSDGDPDYPALVLATYLFGGSSSSRLFERVREKEGLSYSVYAGFSASALDKVAAWRVSAIFAPQNRGRVERAVREELSRAAREGFSEKEVADGKRGLLEARRLARTQDRALAGRLASYLFLKRTFEWDAALEAKIRALTPEEVTAALRRHIDPARLSLISAGDFKKK